ncbi:MAG: hypothetical protein ACWA6U_15045 [Breznakibacter sp.]
MLLCGYGCTSPHDGVMRPAQENLQAIERLIYYQPQLVEQSVDSLAHLLAGQGHHPLKAQMAFLCAFMEYHRGNIVQAATYLEKSLVDFTRQQNGMGQAKCYMLLGFMAEGAGFYEQAKINYYHTINLLVDRPCKERGLAYLGVARCKKNLNDSFSVESAVGISELEATGDREFQLYADFSTFIFGVQDAEVVTKLKQTARAFLDLGLLNNAANAYKQLSLHYMENNRLDSAMSFIDQAIALYDDKYSQVSLVPGFYQYKGILYRRQGNLAMARESYTKALSLYDAYGKIGMRYYALMGLSEVEALEGNYQGAFSYQTDAFNSYKLDQLKEKQFMGRVAEMDLKMLEMNRLMEDVKNKTMQLVAIIIVLLACFLVVFMFVRHRNQKRVAREQERIRNYQNMLIMQGEKKMMAEKMQTSPRQVEIPITADMGIDNFCDCFRETIGQIALDFPLLTKSETIYAVMFALNLSSDIIAEMQNIQPDTLRKVRQRIRQKLKLEADIPADAEVPLEAYFLAYVQQKLGVRQTAMVSL